LHQRDGTTSAAKEKRRSEGVAKVIMKIYISLKWGTKKKFKDPSAPKRPPPAFLLCSEYRPQPADLVKKLGEMWNRYGCR
jgi:high mobility group protein B1